MLVYTLRTCFDVVTTNVQVEIQCNRIETVSRAAVLPFEITDAAHRYSLVQHLSHEKLSLNLVRQLYVNGIICIVTDDS